MKEDLLKRKWWKRTGAKVADVAQQVARQQGRQHKGEGGSAKGEYVAQSGGGGTKGNEVAHMWCMGHKRGGG